MPSEEIFIIIPCFNEGETIISLLKEIDGVVSSTENNISVIVVEDSSTDNTLQSLLSVQLSQKLKLKILSLQFNIGHQGAIAQGLLYAHSEKASCAIVMDGDGEDDPRAIPDLIALKNNDIVHVIRGKRRENLFFRISYGIYKTIFRFLTSKRMNFGNYCLLSERVIAVASSRTFIHLAAFLSKLPFKSETIMYDRRPRSGGTSKMNITSLVHHAFRSFIEYAQSLLMIFLRLFVILFVLFILTIGYIIYLKIFTDYPIIGWSSTFGIGLLTAALVCVGFFITGVLLLNLSQYRMNIPPVAVYKVVK